MPTTQSLITGFAALGVFTVALGCVDVTPITDLPDAGAAATTDASVSPAVAMSACFGCAGSAGVSCKDTYAACEADPKCLSLFLCGIPRGCYAPGQDLVACLTTCGIRAGLTGIDDPAVPPFLALYTCAAASCSAECASTADAGEIAPPQ